MVAEQLLKERAFADTGRSTDGATYNSLLWQTLCTIPQLVQRQCAPVVNMFVGFIGAYYASLLPRSSMGDDTPPRKSSNRKLADGRLVDYLKLFTLFDALASCPSAGVLKEIFAG